MHRTLFALAALCLAPLAAASDPLPQSGVRMLLHDPAAFDKPADRCEARACRDLLKLIQNAEHSLDFAVYGMRNQSALLTALIEAKRRGVIVRGIVDKDATGRSYYSDTDALIAAIGDVKDDYEFDRREASRSRGYERDFEKCERPFGFEGPLQCLGYRIGGQCVVSAHASREPLSFSGFIMHHKFLIADKRYVWAGSTNWSDSGTGGYNANFSVTIDSAKVAEWYGEEFNQMFLGDFHTDKMRTGKRKNTTLADGTALEVYFTPQDRPMQSAVRPLIQRASTSIDISVFFLTHKFITKDLIDAKQRGVKIRVIIDASGATNGYSKHQILRVAGIPVKIENYGGKMHAKAAMIDGQHIVMGSMNWTSAGAGQNDENTIVLHSTHLASRYKTWFDKMWGEIDDRWLTDSPQPESRDSGTACTDGVDNDHDHDADAKDRDCDANPPAPKPLPPVTLVELGNGHNLVKGVKDEGGKQVFMSYGTPGYDSAWIDKASGEEWFCSEMEAEAAGWDRGY